MRDLDGRTALVTGAASPVGIGFASACAMAEIGANIVLSDLASQAARLEDNSETLRDTYGARVLVKYADMTDDASLTALVDATITEFGALDILFNNAGIGLIRDFEATDIDTFDRMYRINQRAPILLSQLALRHMRPAGRGVIINNASSSGVYGVRGQTHYCATKHAVIGFTKALAGEVGQFGIRVLAICPGLVRTEIYLNGLAELGLDAETEMAKMAETAALGRFADPDEVGRFVAFAASDRASYLTGSHYHIHGGMPLDALV